LKKKRALINNLAETIGRMHNQNIFHHDLKTCNIMVKEKGKSPCITFLDFDKVSFEEEITILKRVQKSYTDEPVYSETYFDNR
jgi:tRNA A-37 threonylcarbamoyl transferase component Bud32